MGRVLRGEVMHADRDELVSSLDPLVGPESEAVAAAYADLRPLAAFDPAALVGEAEWLARALRHGPEAWVPLTVARVLRAVRVGDVRDVLVDLLVALKTEADAGHTGDYEGWVKFLEGVRETYPLGYDKPEGSLAPQYVI